MRLSPKLKLKNFKSFCKKTTLKMESSSISTISPKSWPTHSKADLITLLQSKNYFITEMPKITPSSYLSQDSKSSKLEILF